MVNRDDAGVNTGSTKFPPYDKTVASFYVKAKKIQCYHLSVLIAQCFSRLKGQCDVFKADEPDISGLTLAGIIVLIEKNIFIPVCNLLGFKKQQNRWLIRFLKERNVLKVFLRGIDMVH